MRVNCGVKCESRDLNCVAMTRLVSLGPQRPVQAKFHPNSRSIKAFNSCVKSSRGRVFTSQTALNVTYCEEMNRV